MKKLYLITGFLGAGKTTFVNNAGGLFKGQRTAVIVNEFGKKGVDGGLIAEKGYDVTEISNGSIFCVCRVDMFIEALRDAAGRDFDVLIVETSGLSDPSNMGEVLDELKKISGFEYDYRGCICLIDALNFCKVITSAVAVEKQVRNASLAVINKTDLIDDEKAGEIEKMIREMNPSCEIIRTVYSEIPEDCIKNMVPVSPSGGGRLDITSVSLVAEFDSSLTKAEFKKIIDKILPDIYRIKGYAELSDGTIFIDGVSGNVNISDSGRQSENGIVILYDSRKPVKKTLIREGVKIV